MLSAIRGKSSFDVASLRPLGFQFTVSGPPGQARQNPNGRRQAGDSSSREKVGDLNLDGLFDWPLGLTVLGLAGWKTPSVGHV
jgi:hypothetical protein